MRHELILAPMVAADLDRVVEIERQCFPSPWSAGLFLHELQLEFSRVVVARSPAKGPILAFACWWIVADEAHILKVAVAPDSRIRGIGRALVANIVEDGIALGARVVGLEVRRDNTAAVALYERAGFECVGERRDYYGAGRDAVLMELAIPDGALNVRGEKPRPVGVA